MLLYLVQHGASKLEAEDPQRPLNEEGRQTVARLAACLARQRIPLDAIEHSDKLRARQTAEILNAQLRPAQDARQVSGLAPNDNAALTAARLQNEACNLMLVGHLPHLSRLASSLLGLPLDQPAVRFQMGGCVCLERDADGKWAVRWMLVPEILP
ncbi:MAG TPA: phosphohistidine phosphatase SixA [Terriglobales bacterium]|nr:phosphohistidine phosphatase SixA [Terriglobales bacterium]